MAKIYVGCKLPNGLVMELITPHEFKQSTVPMPRDDEHTIKLNGANSQRIARTNPAEPAYGITEVDEAFAKEWFERNAKLAFVKSGAVFMVGSKSAFNGEVKDRMGDVHTGLEPLNANDGGLQPGVEVDKAQSAATLLLLSGAANPQ